jgi:hypothetical protein
MSYLDVPRLHFAGAITAAPKAMAADIECVLSLPEPDPNFMPVTREMSRWIKAGCPR